MPTQAFAPWHEFYALLGSASATMVGLLFVAASVGSGIFTRNRVAAQRMFLSGTIVHFGVIFAICLIVLAPIQNPMLLGAMIAGCGIFGVGYYAIAWLGAIRDGLIKAVNHEDRIWYALLPALGYCCEAAAGTAIPLRIDIGCPALAVSVAGILMIALHNAWDITIWSVTRPRD